MLAELAKTDCGVHGKVGGVCKLEGLACRAAGQTLRLCSMQHVVKGKQPDKISKRRERVAQTTRLNDTLN